MTVDGGDVAAREGMLPDGTKYLTQTPAGWNGTLLLYSSGPPVGPEEPAWNAEQPIVRALLARGYAIAGCGTTLFWPLEQNLPNQIAVLDRFAQLAGHPRRTIAWGQSIGGLMTAALEQYAPERLDGALALCGPLAGGVATHNQQLDCTFVFKTLLGPDSGLELVRITRPHRNLEIALALLESAQATPAGRARLSLAAAMANIPGSFDPAAPEPAADDFAARQLNQYRWFEAIDWHVFLEARATLEQRGRGNPSWNTESDYAELLRASIDREQVEALYAAAGLDLEVDLELLARTPRISADPVAVDYFERYIAFNGHLGGVPLISMHSLGDGLVPVDHPGTYGDVVRWAGNHAFLRQLYIRRGGHCSFTPAETLTAFEALIQRIDTGAWPVRLDAEALNATAAALSPEYNALSRTIGSVALDRRGRLVEPAFVEFTPPPFARPHDIRHVR
jgi:hypothetical protein